MPYYREEFLNKSEEQSLSRYTLTPGSTQHQVFHSALDSSSVLSFRNKPHPRALHSVIVPDHVADPYASFLNNVSRRDYQARLSERGLPALGEPDRGHAFELKRHIVRHRDLRVSGSSFNGYRANNMAIIGYPSASNSLQHIHKGDVFNPAPYKEVDLEGFAQMAYNRTAPTPVVFDAANFLGELSEGLPRLSIQALQSASRFFKNAGSDYLNVEFGWKPFISDILAAGSALSAATRQLAQDGKRVHRKYSLPPVRSDAFTSYNSNFRIGGGYHGVLSPDAVKASGMGTGLSWSPGAQVPHTLRKTRRVSRWFEGEFSSFYPLGFDPENYFHRFDQLVNTKLTPDVLWELAPWSWLIDWNLRIGDSIEANVKAANDRLVMHYGYAMEHTVYTTSVSNTFPGTNAWTSTGWPATADWYGETTYKRRIRANPYGFRVTKQESFTGGQLGILGALGLTMFKW